ncbi:MAG: DUF1540 domain-containing protein [Oscillospiraceae bacterium]
MDHQNGCGCVKGVGCDVYNCKYNDVESKCCKAEHINVQNKTAVSKAETFCDTFAPKASV